MNLDDLEQPKRTLAEKIVLRSPPEKFRSVILVSRNIRLVRMFAGFPGQGRRMTVGFSKTDLIFEISDSKAHIIHIQ